MLHFRPLALSEHPFVVGSSFWKSTSKRMLRNPIKNPGKCGKHLDVGSGGGGLGAIFTERFRKRVARKLRIIILLHFGLVTFRTLFPEDPKVIIFMFFELGGCLHGPQHQLFSTLGPPRYYSNNSNKNIFWKIIVLELSKSWKSNMLKISEKTETETSWRSV